MRTVLLFLLSLPLSAQSHFYYDLAGPWRAIEGDDLRYAQTDFDDSGWRVVTLPASRPRRGGFDWMRRAIDLPPGTDTSSLSLTLGAISESYEVYVNGALAGSTGPLNIEHAQLARPRTFDLKPLTGARFVVAIRILRIVEFGSNAWMIRDTGPYLLTASSMAPRGLGQATIDRRRLERSPRLVIAGLTLMMAIFIVLVWIGERARQELLWLAIVLGISSWEMLNQVVKLSPDSTPFATSPISIELLTLALPTAALARFALAALAVRARWIHILIWIPLGLTLLPVGLLPFGAFLVNRMELILIAFILVWPWPRAKDDHRPNRELNFFRVAIALALFNHVSSWERFSFVASLQYRIQTGPYDWPRYGVTLTIISFFVTIVLTRRLAADRQEKLRLANEVEAARVVQQLLLSHSVRQAGTYRVDAIYEPAQQVGGDFFWTRTDPDGSLLVMVGDVSGKGLKAAMMVTLIMGALRRDDERAPGAILTRLNRAIAGELRGGFVTACCVRADADGRITAANAGHLAPYCRGVEAEVPGELPLGLTPDIAYEETVLTLAPGETLTLVSDGVVEAADSKGVLFGFDRTRAISGQSAQVIAEAAQAWGQNDDITVVTVRRRQ